MSDEIELFNKEELDVDIYPRGPKGDKGDTGEQGIQGPKGDKGDTGEQGYTPIKGIDYFTSSDIASLNIPSKTSDLTNDSGFTNKKYVDDSISSAIGTALGGSY